ncbi:MAG: hypothetical protein HQL23_01165 [Candidatus Omnitrophica bacterium]|nr:hypothetical protein [Candidatus Omnitrophota bacterium]
MKCFNHPNAEAVGVCKGCGKGLCLACAKDSEYGLSCAGKCETELKLMRDVLYSSDKAYGQLSPIYSRYTAVLGMIGGICLIPNIFLLVTGKNMDYASLLFGIVMLVAAVWYYKISSKFKVKNTKK